MIKALDLCSGIGGFRIGVMESCLKNSVEFIGYSDIDKYANKGYAAMHDVSNEIAFGDMQKLTRLDSEFSLHGLLPIKKEREEKINNLIPDFNILFAGFPCQPHSLMGNRKGNIDARGNIFYDIEAILKIKKPDMFILENVKSLKSVNEGKFFKEILQALRNIGYKVITWVLNAADYGITQTRRRVFIIGSLNRELPREEDIPPKVDSSKREYLTTWHLLEKEVDEKYFLSERILKTILKSQHKGYNRKAEINKLVARPITKTMHKMHRASQDNYFSNEYIQGSYDEIQGKVNLKLNGARKIRRITPREAFRIQSFPEHLIDKLLNSDLSDTRLYMLAGNAVPPKLVTAVINQIIQYEPEPTH